MLDALLEAPDEARRAVDDLHRRCGVYTKSELVDRVLDLVGWTARSDLTTKRLLEPAAGDGQFVVAAAVRLVKSLRSRKRPLTIANLGKAITAYELHPVEAEKARINVASALAAVGMRPSTAHKLACRWIRQGDFLLSNSQVRYSHIVGNPPYVRWSTIPLRLKQAYEAALAPRMTKGDLFLPFLDRGVGLLAPNGRLGLVCSDRWKFMAFAQQFREEVLPQIVIEHDEQVEAEASYLRRVDAYASLLVWRRPKRLASPAIGGRARPMTLAEAGYVVKVGPALGCTPAFVLPKQPQNTVELELLAPWLDGTEVKEGSINWSGRMVLCLHDEAGALRDISNFPNALAHMKQYERELKGRSISSAGTPWYRPIDKVQRSVWDRPKLLIPELAKVPRVALDLSGTIPSHGVYAIFAPTDDLTALYEQLKGGGLARGLVGNAPKIKGGYVRCYKRFLDALECDHSVS